MALSVSRNLLSHTVSHTAPDCHALYRLHHLHGRIAGGAKVPSGNVDN